MKKKLGFKNSNLEFDIEKIDSFDVPITVSKDFDGNLEYPFILDVEDAGYFYISSIDRDFDFELLKSAVPQLSFIEL